MSQQFPLQTFLYGLIITFLVSACGSTAPPSANPVFGLDEQANLHYIPDPNGNILPDFSYSGYKQSEQPIPHIEVALEITPIQGDNTSHIQNAIDYLATLPIQSNGFRGALLLKKGTYPVAGQLIIRQSGIVMRGEGQNSEETLIVATGKDRRSLILSKGNLQITKHRKQKLVGSYIPVGSKSVKVSDIGDFAIGQNVMLHRPATAKWISDIGMDKIPKRSDGRAIKQWQPKSFSLNYERKIIDIQGNELFLDIPLVQMMEEKYGGGFIFPITTLGRIAHIGIENLALKSEYEKRPEQSDEEHSWIAIELADTEHAWVSNVTGYHFAHSLVAVKRGSRFVTVRDSIFLDPVSQIRGGRRYSYLLEGAQALFLRCYARNGRHDFITSSRVAGPSAFVYSAAEKTHSDIGPHHRWATGILYDNIKGGDINIQDRGNYGSGHGWVGAQQVLWNTKSSGRTSVQSPPTGINWSIGHIGKRWQGRFKRPQGVWISQDQHVTPDSLFVQQLRERIGDEMAAKVLAKANQ